MWNATNVCPYCSGGGVQTIHHGQCPKVKAFEYFPDGSVKRVEFHGEPEQWIDTTPIQPYTPAISVTTTTPWPANSTGCQQ